MLQIEEYARKTTSWPKLVEQGVMVFILINYPDGVHWICLVFWKEKISYLYTVFDSMTGSRTANAGKIVEACVHLYTAMDISWRSRSGTPARAPLRPHFWNCRVYDDIIEQPPKSNRCGYYCIARAYQVYTSHAP